MSGAGVMAGIGARTTAPLTHPASTTAIIPIEANERIVGQVSRSKASAM
jgi:hypothetical protein